VLATIAPADQLPPGDFTLGTVYERLKQRLGEDDAAFYLATPPQFFGVIVDRLADAGLTEEHDGGFRRVVIEKPFGHDLDPHGLSTSGSCRE
jgi:glucose-6-phosphate 1-dehydrogenase